MLRVFAIIAACFACLAISAFGFGVWFASAPVAERVSTLSQGETLDVLEEEAWRSGVHTILLAGEDDGFGGNDVIMVALLDTTARSLDVLSIPRDTLVDVPWELKKINSIQHLYRQLPDEHEHYIYALRDEVAKLIGYPTDHWITLDLNGFVALVDAIGGIEVDVPRRMAYSDPEQGLWIDLQPGLQRLDGTQAMGLVRFRSYADGDISRMQMQHVFLGALADQLLSVRNLLRAHDLAGVFRDHVTTDLSLRNLAFFASALMRLEPENIRFHSVDENVANIADNVNGISYVTLYAEPWTEMINRYMNPFTFEIVPEDLEIPTWDSQARQFFTTNGALR